MQYAEVQLCKLPQILLIMLHTRTDNNVLLYKQLFSQLRRTQK